MQRVSFGVLAWCVLSLSPVIVGAKAPTAPDDFTNKLVTFDEVLEEIRKAQEGGDWKTPGWKPHATKTWLDHLLAEVKQATKRDKLKLPVDFDQVKPVAAEQVVPSQEGVLHVIKDGRIRSARQSIILADGSVELSIAEGCIIIARGAVTINSSQRNVIVAGEYAGIGFDRSSALRIRPVLPAPNGVAPAPAPAPDASDASLILSAGILDIGSANGTICCGLGRLIVSNANQGAIVLNSSRREISAAVQFEALDAPQLPFTRKAGKNPLEEKLNVTQVVTGTTTDMMMVLPGGGADRTMGMAVLERGGVEYVLRQDAAITDERGQPMAGLQNWKLDFLGRDYALFANGRQYAGFYVKQ